MTDIVERLRKHDDDEASLKTESLLREAADEIERLREERDELFEMAAVWSDSEECKMLTAENERLRQERDELFENNGWCANELGKAKAEIERLRSVLRYIAYETDPDDGQTMAAAALREKE